MILSERELELGSDHAGIMRASTTCEPGTPLADVLPLADDVLEIETTDNRPDLTSSTAIAREVAALLGGELAAARRRSRARRRRAGRRRGSRTSSGARGSSAASSATCTSATSPRG